MSDPNVPDPNVGGWEWEQGEPTPPVVEPQPGWASHGAYWNKNRKNRQSQEIIGVVSPVLIWCTLSGRGDSTAGSGGGLTMTTFDTTTRSDSARILLTNASGSQQLLKGIVIQGKPVTRLSGDEGWVHDSFIDTGDIRRNGTKVFELANNWIFAKDQVESLADYHHKDKGKAKHLYQIVLPGNQYWYEKGDWYTLEIGDAGQPEYISSTVEVYGVTCDGTATELGTTVVTFIEVEEAWKKDSTAAARFIANGQPWRRNAIPVLIVQPRYALQIGNYYCDGVSDEDEINAAIDAAAIIGGSVELAEGTFYIDGPIVRKGGVSLVGAGIAATIINRNSTTYGITSIGSAGSELAGGVLRDFSIVALDADTDHLIYSSYTDDLTIQNVGVLDCHGAGIYLASSDNCSVVGCSATGCTVGIATDGCSALLVQGCVASACTDYGIMVWTSSSAKLASNSTHDCGVDGIYCEGSNALISANESYSNVGNGIQLSGPFGGSERCTVTGNICRSNSASGIVISGDADDNSISANICTDNGVYGIYLVPISTNRPNNNVVTGNRASGNTTSNYIDSGSSTTATGNDWT